MQLDVFTFETLETEIGVTEVVPLFYTGPRALYILLIISICLFIVELYSYKNPAIFSICVLLLLERFLLVNVCSNHCERWNKHS